MEFDWTNEEKEIRQRVASLYNDEAVQEILALDGADLAAIRKTTLKQLARLAETGYLGLAQGPAKSEDLVGLTAGQEELALISGSFFLAVEVTARLFGGLINGWGEAALLGEILLPVQNGEMIGAVAVAEPGGPEPMGDWQTTAARDGDFYVVSGRKSFVTNGPVADWLAVAGTFQDKLCFFLVKPGQDGVKPGPRIPTLGYNGLAVCSLELDRVRVPSNLVLGPFEDNSPLTFLQNMQDLSLAMTSLGVLKRLLDGANTHARTHHRGAKPIFAHQEVRFKLADMFTLYQTAQLLIYRAAWFMASGDREAEVLIGCAKVFCAEAAEKVSSLAMQVLAGQGYVAGHPVEKGYREAKYAALAGTTSEKARMNIARDVLKRFPV